MSFFIPLIMAIYPEVPNYDDSPWHKIMEERAIVWQQFADEHSFLTHGVYSANYVSFTIGTLNKNILIKGKRSLINVSNGIFPQDGVFNEKLILKIKKKDLETRNYINVNQSGILNFIRKKHSNISNYKEYLINYNNESILLKLKELNLFTFEKLYKLTINKKGIKLVLLELPANSEIIADFVKP